MSRIGDGGFRAITQRFDDKFTHDGPTFVGPASDRSNRTAIAANRGRTYTDLGDDDAARRWLDEAMGLAESTTEVTVRGLRDLLQAFSMRAVLDAHYEEHPELRPELWEIAVAGAELAGDPLAHNKRLIRRAAQEVLARRPHATPEDVLLYAEGLQSKAE